MALTNPAAAAASVPSPATTINPLLLASACSGYFEGLNILLNSQGASGDEELPFDLQEAYASVGSVQLTPESLLNGVTVEGDTALHAVASNGDGDNFLSSANTIYSKAEHLLFVQNKRGDTPLHLAARAGKYIMVSHLIDLANEIVVGVSRPTTIAAARLKALLETQNKLKETALHDAVRTESGKMVMLLMEKDPELAMIPEKGTSPLYLAISLGNKTITETMYGKSGGILSYSGPNGQNALHVAVRRGADLTKLVLKWNKDLTTERDENGSTPLHFAIYTPLRFAIGTRITCQKLLEANPAALYQSDNDGLFPIHAAASVGARKIVALFLDKCPNSAGMRDAKGRTFLHAAVEADQVWLVDFVSGSKSLSWIMNMRDNDGNTALHLAVQKVSLVMFRALLMNLHVELNLTNKKGQTPLDTAKYKDPSELHYGLNSEVFIKNALIIIGAPSGVSREDHEYVQQHRSRDESKESKMINDATRNLSVGSVLIATMTFGASFALPGGYRADDRKNGGAPTLVGRYAFDAFVIANTLSFVCSAVATMGFMFSGNPIVNLASRRWYFDISTYLMSISISSLTTAFALGGYMVLAPVAHKTAIAICVVSSLIVLSVLMEPGLKAALLARPLAIRKGLILTMLIYALGILVYVLISFWPIIFSFGWAAIVNHQASSEDMMLHATNN